MQVDPGASLELKGDVDFRGGAVRPSNRRSSRFGLGDRPHGHTDLGYGDVALGGEGTEIVGEHGTNSALYNDIYIVGSGRIGNGDGSLRFVNNGYVEATGAGAGPIVINTGDLTVNTGTLEALGLSELDLYGTYDNAHGTIGAYSDGVGPSVVKLFGATIEGGLLQTDSADAGRQQDRNRRFPRHERVRRIERPRGHR